jgi:hypothetical protein
VWTRPFSISWENFSKIPFWPMWICILFPI